MSRSQSLRRRSKSLLLVAFWVPATLQLQGCQMLSTLSQIFSAVSPIFSSLSNLAGSLGGASTQSSSPSPLANLGSSLTQTPPAANPPGANGQQPVGRLTPPVVPPAANTGTNTGTVTPPVQVAANTVLTPPAADKAATVVSPLPAANVTKVEPANVVPEAASVPIPIRPAVRPANLNGGWAEAVLDPKHLPPVEGAASGDASDRPANLPAPTLVG